MSNTIGIDAINFYTSRYYLELGTLAKALNADVGRFHGGSGQYQMGICPPDEDAVTLGANAAHRLLTRVDVEGIDHLLYATESGIDESKAAGIYIHRLLNLPSTCSVIEIKQACYSATAAIHMAIGLVKSKKNRKVLVIASDVSRYELNTPGESSQGCGAVAMLITENPRLLSISPERGLYTEDVMDFWRPNYRREPFVEGKHSVYMYLKGLEETWRHYQAESQLSFVDHDYHCYHVPIPSLAEKAHMQLAKMNNVLLSKEQAQQQLTEALFYNYQVGNCYTASLYISLVSLLDQPSKKKPGSRIGFYSYGSGCVAEYFSGVLQPAYEDVLDTAFHRECLDSRKALSYEQYKEWHTFQLPEDGGRLDIIPSSDSRQFRLCGIENHKRCYA